LTKLTGLAIVYAKFFKLKMPGDVAMTVQDLVYTPPI
jgi:hypothetical protein